ncbi:hypothetical protein, partial [Pseudonocardia sp. Ae150A_Ps1]
MGQAAVELGERLRSEIKEYEQRTGQSSLSMRKLARQMRDAGVQISHESLRRALAGTHVPPTMKLQEIAAFFGTSFLAFDVNLDPRCVRVMGRLARLDDAGRVA